MAAALVPVSKYSAKALKEMHLADAPDYITAVAAGIAHGLSPREALRSSWMQWMRDNRESVEAFKLAHFHGTKKRPHAMTDFTGLVQLLCIVVAEQGNEIARLRKQVPSPATRRITSGKRK